MTADDFRRLALDLPVVEERSHFGKPDFCVAGKVFASLGPDPGRGTVRLSAEEQEMVLAAKPSLGEPAAGAWGRQGWMCLDLAGADEATLKDLLTRAWGHVARKRLRS